MEALHQWHRYRPEPSKLFIYSPDDQAAEFAEPLIEAALGQDNQVLEVAGSAHA